MKVQCQALCTKCYHEKGRTQEFDVNDLIWFCISCKKVFLCDIGVAQSYNQRGNVAHSCNICKRPLIKEEVDKTIIAKKSVPGNHLKTENLYQRLMRAEKKRKTKKRLLRRSTKQTTTLSVYEQSQISELCDVDGLTVPLILEFALDFEIKKIKDYYKNKEISELLLQLAQEDPAIIPFFYSALLKLEPNPRAFELRFAVFCSSYLSENSKIKLPPQSTSRKYDIKIVEASGTETWIYCSEKDLDIDNLENLAERVFNIKFEDFPNLKRIFLVANSFSYLAKGLIMKYQSVLTGLDSPLSESSTGKWESIPLTLWQPLPRKLLFQQVSLQ
ncbi:MAG: hypothetical protein ACFFB5_06235 [Promethearchaeota archaeon]